MTHRVVPVQQKAARPHQAVDVLPERQREREEPHAHSL